MKTLDFNLSSNLNGGKITGFNYSRSLNELVGTWSAEVANGSFTAGNSISIGNVMADGIITNAYKDNTGLWHLEGKDAGIKLMKTTPDIEILPKGDAGTVIRYLADFCGVSLSMSGTGLSGFNVRSVISGSTCAEAILELAMFSGMIAYINNAGQLIIAAPSASAPSFENVINDSGSDIDLDGYATQVLVSLTSRQIENQEESSSGETEEYYSGETPSDKVTQEKTSGSFSNGSYSMTMLQPLDVIKKLTTTITENGVTITTVETHNYDIKTQTVWHEDQEYVLFAFIETGYEIVKTVEGSYSGQSFKEITTETLSRDMGIYDPVNVPDDWKNKLNMVDEETLTRSTVREGAPAPKDGMPAYSPPFDCQTVRTFKREKFGKALLCNETETRYEERQLGSISPVKVDGEVIPHFMLGSDLAIQTHSTPQWIPIKSYRTYFEQYGDDGECLFSTRSEHCDDGAEWLSANGISDTGDEELNEYEKAYAKFTQNSQGLEVSVGSSQIETAWQYLELKGRTKTLVNLSDSVNLGNTSEWYDNGDYLNSLTVCPHINSGQCNVCTLAGDNTTNCTELNSYGNFRPNFNFRKCLRAKAALEKAREQDVAEITPAIVGTASKGSAAIGYQRDIYVDEVLKDDTAQIIADTIAANILKIKSNKGIRKTVTIPYDASILPNGNITEVSHDWQNMQTSVTYLDSGDIPEFMITQSMSSVAAFVTARENNKHNIPKYGVVVSVNPLSVQIGNSRVSCTTRLKNLGENDIVLVIFAAGNKVRGQVIARL